jgi:hypothetical protein
MGYFDFKRPVNASYLDRRNPPYINRNRVVGHLQRSVQSDFNVGGPMNGGMGGGGSGLNYDQVRFNSQRDRLEEGSIVEDWIPRQPTLLHLLLRRIYLRDVVAGTVADIYSTLPWGKIYELIGIDDPKVLQMFHDMIESLGIWGDMPLLSREVLVIGRAICSLPFNETTGLWDSFVPIDPDQARLTPMPISRVKPLIDVLSSPAWRSFANSVDPRIIELKENMNKDLVSMLQNTTGYLPLDPMNTLFLARRVNQYDHIGTSIYSRILPAWAYEMALWNASLTGVRRRNRSILLITAGEDDVWEPNENELSSLTSLFMQADEDPTGSVISVRNGVEVSEVRDPTAIWGISQEFEFLSTLKMRALGVSEAYLQGDANVSNMETARTSLGKSVASFRDHTINEIFTRQLFPTFARLHNFQKRTQAEISHKIRYAPSFLQMTKEYDQRMRENDRLDRWGFPVVTAKQALEVPLDALLMPKLITEDTLRPEQDAAYLDMLSKLKEEGMPIPLRIWASAAGYDLDKAIAMMPEDNIIRKRLTQLGTQDAGGDAGGGGGDDLFGGGGGMDSEPSGGAPEAEPAKPPSAEDLFKEEPGGAEKAGKSKIGDSPTLPPKWGFTAKAGAKNRTNPFGALGGSKANLKQVESALKKFEKGQDPYLKMMSTLDPRIVADLRISRENILVPYED